MTVALFAKKNFRWMLRLCWLLLVGCIPKAQTTTLPNTLTASPVAQLSDTPNPTVSLTLVDIVQPTPTSASEPTITPTPSFANRGLIVFTGGNDLNNPDIYTIRADGDRGTITNLTDHPAIDTGPSWSPDGTRIAFWSNRESGHFYLYLMNADGSDVHKLMNEPGLIHAPSWSPDGTRLAFSIDNDEPAEVYILDVQTQAITNLLNQPTGNNDAAGNIMPAWSPDGNSIAFASGQDRESGADIYTVNVDGSNLFRLTNELLSATDPEWAPDSTKIIYTCDDAAICIIYTDGSSKTKLIDPSIDFKDGNNPSLSPDGQFIVFESLRELDNAIYIIGLEGSRTTRLTNVSDVLFAGEPDWQPTTSSP